MEFVMGSGGVPVGSYRAKFVGVEPYTERQEQYGPGLALRFEVLDVEHAGAVATRICSQKMTPKSVLGKLAVAIKGSAIAHGESFSFANYVGVTGSIIVEETDSGGSRVSAFLRDSTPTAQPTPQPATSSGEF